MTNSTNKDIEVEVNVETSENQCENRIQNKLPDGGWAWRVVFASFVCNIVLGKYLTYFKVNFFQTNLAGIQSFQMALHFHMDFF